MGFVLLTCPHAGPWDIAASRDPLLGTSAWPSAPRQTPVELAFGSLHKPLTAHPVLPVPKPLGAREAKEKRARGLLSLCGGCVTCYHLPRKGHQDHPQMSTTLGSSWPLPLPRQGPWGHSEPKPVKEGVRGRKEQGRAQGHTDTSCLLPPLDARVHPLLSLSLSVCLGLSLYICLFLSLSFSGSFSLSLFLFPSLSVSPSPSLLFL